MNTGSNHSTILGVFLFGFLLGGASLLLLTSNRAGQFSSILPRDVDVDVEARAALGTRLAGRGGHQRALLSLSDYADPKSVFPKAAATVVSREVQEEGMVRHVRVGSMCRCPSGLLPVPGPMDPFGRDTGIVQPPSLATGSYPRHFILHRSESDCSCSEYSGSYRVADTTSDLFLRKMQPICPNTQQPSNYDWENMPDLGVEESLPVFVGVLSYESPLSLGAALQNWLENDLFRRIWAQDIFIQLNHRSREDDQIIQEFQEKQRLQDKLSPMTVMGSPEDNLNPGLAISRFCRSAEAHPNSHPNGENLLLFLEKDWHFLMKKWSENNILSNEPRHLEEMFRGINALAQRGVPYFRLKPRSKEVPEEKTWPCPAQGYPFECTHANQHRWSNQPHVLSCKWFLRYLEPFALLDDPIMYGCPASMQEKRYVDWEQALQDGRVAWANSQWVMAMLVDRTKLFTHKEVDQ